MWRGGTGGPPLSWRCGCGPTFRTAKPCSARRARHPPPSFPRGKDPPFPAGSDPFPLREVPVPMTAAGPVLPVVLCKAMFAAFVPTIPALNQWRSAAGFGSAVPEQQHARAAVSWRGT